jgi:hypothetical protein
VQYIPFPEITVDRLTLYLDVGSTGAVDFEAFLKIIDEV